MAVPCGQFRLRLRGRQRSTWPLRSLRAGLAGDVQDAPWLVDGRVAVQ